MNIGAIVLSENDLNFEIIKEYFQNGDNVLNVSEISNDKNVIDYRLLRFTMPSNINDRPNIYGLYVKKRKENWKLVYVGQRKHEGILERLRQHLVSKHALTGSKLENVNKALNEGFEIGVKLFSVRPDSMRLYYEERLISEFDLEWNQQKHKSLIVNLKSNDLQF